MGVSSDHDLIAACLRGDQRAWTRIVSKYERYVFSIGRSEGLSREEAEDLTQAVFLELVQQLGRIDGTTRIAGWLGTVSRRLAWRRRDLVRRNEPRSPDDDVFEIAAVEDSTDRTADLFALSQSLKQIDDRCSRLLTRLYFSDGDPAYQAVASELDIPIGSIGPTRARCLEKLRKVLDKDPDYDSMTYRAVRIIGGGRKHQSSRSPNVQDADIDNDD